MAMLNEPKKSLKKFKKHMRNWKESLKIKKWLNYKKYDNK
jgi:hypothetical protein